MKLRGKVALVTGAARGLGRAYALRLASLGADVVSNDINLDAAREFDEELSAPTVMEEVWAYGGRSLGIRSDVTKKDQVDAMVDQILHELGRIDILVNNADGALTPFERGFASTMPEDDLRFILDVNLMSTIFCCQAVSPRMKAQNRAGHRRLRRHGPFPLVTVPSGFPDRVNPNTRSGASIGAESRIWILGKPTTVRQPLNAGQCCQYPGLLSSPGEAGEDRMVSRTQMVPTEHVGQEPGDRLTQGVPGVGPPDPRRSCCSVRGW